jgi:hypothetical protein
MRKPRNYIEAFYNFKPYMTRRSWNIDVVVEVTLKHHLHTSSLYINNTEIARLDYDVNSGQYQLYIFLKDRYRFIKKVCEIYKGIVRGVKTLDENINITINVDECNYCIIVNNNKYVYDPDVNMMLVYGSPKVNIYAQVVKAIYFNDDEELKTLYEEFINEFRNLDKLKWNLETMSRELIAEFENRFNYLDSIIRDLVSRYEWCYAKWEGDVKILKHRLKDITDIMKNVMIPRLKEYIATAKILNA